MDPALVEEEDLDQTSDLEQRTILGGHLPSSSKAKRSAKKCFDSPSTRSPAEVRTDLAVELLHCMSCCDTDDLGKLTRSLSRRVSFRDMFPEADGHAAVERVVRLAVGFDAHGPDLRKRIEQIGVFLVVRACRAFMPGAEREDATLARRCLGPLLAFVTIVMRDSPDLALDVVRRRNLVKSLSARLPEVWSRTKRAQGENVLHMAFQASQRTRVRLQSADALEIDEDVASIALALTRIEREAVVALPQEAIGDLLGVSHQRISESIERLVKAKFLTRLGQHDRTLHLAKTYRVRTRKTEGIFQVYDRQ